MLEHCIEPWTLYEINVAPYNVDLDGTPRVAIVLTSERASPAPTDLSVVIYVPFDRHQHHGLCRLQSHRPASVLLGSSHISPVLPLCLRFKSWISRRAMPSPNRLLFLDDSSFILGFRISTTASAADLGDHLETTINGIVVDLQPYTLFVQTACSFCTID
jgi:hypothetical protein